MPENGSRSRMIRSSTSNSKAGTSSREVKVKEACIRGAGTADKTASPPTENFFFHFPSGNETASISSVSPIKTRNTVRSQIVKPRITTAPSRSPIKTLDAAAAAVSASVTATAVAAVVAAAVRNPTSAPATLPAAVAAGVTQSEAQPSNRASSNTSKSKTPGKRSTSMTSKNREKSEAKGSANRSVFVVCSSSV